MARRLRFTRPELEQAIAESRSWAETLRRLGYRPAGGNPKTVQKYAARWRVNTDHFDPYASQRGHPHPARIRSNPGEGIQLSPGPPQTSSVRRGDQETNLRALRSGRDLARRGDFHDPRPRQRGSRRQPPRESQNRLSELRCDAVNPLRPEEPQSATRTFLPSLWEGLQAERPSPSLLLPCMRNPLGPERQAQARRAKGNTASSRSAPSGNRKTWLLGRGQEVRSVRQRDSEVDTRLRA